MVRIAFFLLMAVAWLPLWLLYAVGDLLRPVVYHVVRYRRRVVEQNLRNAFPEKSAAERRRIARAYYRHMVDLLVEALYNLRTTPAQIKRHYRLVNREAVDRYYEQGQSVVLLSAHYNNWEYMVAGLNMLLLHHGVGVGKPLEDKKIGSYITRRRIRYGTEVVDQTNVRQVMEYYHRHRVPCAYMMLSDQSPNDVHKCYWTEFLHQETPFIYGGEYLARKYGYPVIYYKVNKVRRGRYEVVFEPLCDNAADQPQYRIEQQYIGRLERLLRDKPEYWLWSHRRWKRVRPPEIPLHAPAAHSTNQ
ncbi:MAG: lipid A biosynthesis lauroyl acyltransferase [bacterium P3]|nr:MAG: lipid A biosynthesis lauroyl acyltransferase [bacterium P3]KWW38710.1 MAG: lipid A biosynthesis lauroyl acyltransferase [bacterium F083]